MKIPSTDYESGDVLAISILAAAMIASIGVVLALAI